MHTTLIVRLKTPPHILTLILGCKEPGQYNLVSDQTCLEQDFEPYIVLPTRWAHKFDQRFVGFGWNKVSYTMELVARGFQYWVLPSVFLVHMPHAPSLDIAKFRSSKSYRR